MADEEILTYLQDVLDAINDMQSCFIGFPKDMICLRRI